MPPRKRNEFFSKLKRDGILRHNLSECKKDVPNYQREHQAKKWVKLMWCSSCRKFIGARGMSRHRKMCSINHCKPTPAIPVELMDCSEVTDDFKVNILSKLRSDEIGKCCFNDKTIRTIGETLYRSIRRKKDKAIQVRKTVRLDMRRLARLYLTFKITAIDNTYNNSRDMFNRKNFPSLREAIEQCSGDEDDFKPGLKQGLVHISYSIKKHACTCILLFISLF